MDIVDHFLHAMRKDKDIRHVRGLPCCKSMACRAYDEGMAALSGPKVLAFCKALDGDDAAAVVDTWMRRILQPHGRQALNGYRLTQYETWARALEDASRKAGVSVCTFQATVWLHIKEMYDA